MTDPTPAPTPFPGAAARSRAGTGLDDAQSDALARTLPTGMLLASRYDVRALLGLGGMGAVYHVHDRTREEDVALKVMLPSLLSRGDAKERFRREANIMLRLTHDGIVRVFDFGRDEGLALAFYTMELLRGRTLRGYLDAKKARGALPEPREALAIVGAILDTLRYAHGQKVVHRDLKPENVFLVGPAGDPADAPPGALKILDFGIAKVMDPSKLTKTGAEMGSYCYIAPEQQRDAGTVDQRADLYAVSAILYELLTGRQPVGKFKDASKLRPELPRSADTLIENGLASEPEERTGTAELLGAEVAALGREIQALRAAIGVADGPGPKAAPPPAVAPVPPSTVPPPTVPPPAVPPPTVPPPTVPPRPRSADPRPARPASAAASTPPVPSRALRKIGLLLLVLGLAIPAILLLVQAEADRRSAESAVSAQAAALGARVGARGARAERDATLEWKAADEVFTSAQKLLDEGSHAAATEGFLDAARRFDAATSAAGRAVRAAEASALKAEEERKRKATEAVEAARQRKAAEAADAERRREEAKVAAAIEDERQRLEARKAEEERARKAAEAADAERRREAEAAENARAADERKKAEAAEAERVRKAVAAALAEEASKRRSAEAAEASRRQSAEAAEAARFSWILGAWRFEHPAFNGPARTEVVQLVKTSETVIEARFEGSLRGTILANGQVKWESKIAGGPLEGRWYSTRIDFAGDYRSATIYWPMPDPTTGVNKYYNEITSKMKRD